MTTPIAELDELTEYLCKHICRFEIITLRGDTILQSRCSQFQFRLLIENKIEASDGVYRVGVKRMARILDAICAEQARREQEWKQGNRTQ